MADSESSSNVEAKIEALEKEYAGFKSAMARSRNTRLLVLLGAVALVVVIGYMFYSFAKDITSEDYQKTLLTMAQERLEKNKSDYLKEVQKLVDDSAPILKDAFYNQTKKDMPKYTAAIAQERDAFAKSLETKMRDQVNQHYRALLEKYQERLIKEFPEIDTPELKEKAMNAIEQAFEQLVEKYYVDVLSEGIEDIYAQWDSFPASATAKEDSSSPEDVLIGLLMELVSKKMAN